MPYREPGEGRSAVAGTAAPTTQNASKLVASQGPSNIWDKIN